MTEFVLVVIMPGVIYAVPVIAVLFLASKYGARAIVGVYLLQLLIVCSIWFVLYYQEELRLQTIALRNPHSKSLYFPHLTSTVVALRGVVTEILASLFLLILIRGKTRKGAA